MPPDYFDLPGISDLKVSGQAVSFIFKGDINSVIAKLGHCQITNLLVGAIYALKSSLSSLSEEIRARTADFLFVKPVDRSRVITAKLAAVLVNLVVFNLTTLLTSLFFCSQIQSRSLHQPTDRLFDDGALFAAGDICHHRSGDIRDD